jgi:hypothetical protein
MVNGRQVVRSLSHLFSNDWKTFAGWVYVPRKHRLDPVADDLSQISVVDFGCAKSAHVAMAALVGPDV